MLIQFHMKNSESPRIFHTTVDFAYQKNNLLHWDMDRRFDWRISDSRTSSCYNFSKCSWMKPYAPKHFQQHLTRLNENVTTLVLALSVAILAQAETGHLWFEQGWQTKGWFIFVSFTQMYQNITQKDSIETSTQDIYLDSRSSSFYNFSNQVEANDGNNTGK